MVLLIVFSVRARVGSSGNPSNWRRRRASTTAYLSTSLETRKPERIGFGPTVGPHDYLGIVEKLATEAGNVI